MKQIEALRDATLFELMRQKASLETFIYQREHGMAPKQIGLTYARGQLAIIKAKIQELEND